MFENIERQAENDRLRQYLDEDDDDEDDGACDYYSARETIRRLAAIKASVDKLSAVKQ